MKAVVPSAQCAPAPDAAEDSGMSGQACHWEQHAKQWRFVGLPLRPSREDVRIMEGLARRYGQAPRMLALLFGVTPELAAMDWPDGTRLLAVDRSEGMIRHVWPQSGMGIASHMIRGDWNALPIRGGSLDMVIGDGFYTPLNYPQDYLRLGAELVRVLRPGGLYLIRAFIRPDVPETIRAIKADLFAARIGSFHAFKWRLAMALHGSLQEGVQLSEVWNQWHAMRCEADQAGVSLSWPAEEIATIDAYRGVAARYTFPTLAELRDVLQPHFIEKECHIPGYELGGRCPILLLARR
jgi:SAM-dependent methyltransferase